MRILKVKCLAPTRLDNYLMQQFPALNPGRLNKALRENKIKLNGKKQPLSTRVMAGDEIKLFILDEVLDADKRVEGPAWKNARGPAQVIYDCPQILVVNKPAGLSVDGPEDDTLLNRALLYLNQKGEYKENDLYTPALCHRLDTGTSGLVILAKTPEAEQLFLEVIKNREVKKTYLDERSPLHVMEAENNMEIQKGCAYIARGGKHMEIVRRDGKHYLILKDGPAREGVRPCANFMYESLAESGYARVVCVVMTGMGADGTAGIRNLHQKKPIYVIAQQKESCAVYGMPRSIVADRKSVV